MKTDRIETGKIYMALYKNKHIRFQVDMLVSDTVLGTNMDTKRGAVVKASDIISGPLKEDTEIVVNSFYKKKTA